MHVVVFAWCPVLLAAIDRHKTVHVAVLALCRAGVSNELWSTAAWLRCNGVG